MNQPQTDEWGIYAGYHDILGHWHETTDQTRSAFRSAMHSEEDAPSGAFADVIVAHQGETHPLSEGELILESGERIAGATSIPRDIPIGYHELKSGNGKPVRILIAPPRCYVPPGLREWGWAVQLYSLRSQNSWGIGDLGDLRKFAEWSAGELGAGVVVVNPLCAPIVGLPQEPSPYYAGSRLFRNPLYLRIGEIPGAGELGQRLELLETAGRELNRKRLIARDAIYHLKMEALQMLFDRFHGDERFERYRAREARELERFSAFCVLTGRYGRGWQRWPNAFRDSTSEAVDRLIVEEAGRVRFHSWIQWQLEVQLARAGEELSIVQDLPIGVNPDGFDAWLWQDTFAQGISVGAPPDDFNVQGQDWGTPPFIPRRLRAAGYEPFIRTIRASLRYAGGLRVDHVMGLFRLFWIPVGMGAQRGAYVRYNARELLAILAMESQRAKAFIVGEDLGTVEPGVRETLGEHALLSYRVFWFEDRPPAQFPSESLAVVSTHDLPTIAGIWSGSDVQRQRALGLQPNEQMATAAREKLQRVTGVNDAASIQDVIKLTYEAVAEAPSRIVVASLEDGLAVEERPNLPGPLAEGSANWSMALPLTLEAMEQEPLLRSVADSISSKRGKQDSDSSRSFSRQAAS